MTWVTFLHGFKGRHARQERAGIGVRGIEAHNPVSMCGVFAAAVQTTDPNQEGVSYVGAGRHREAEESRSPT
jgi:hypothetical protein